MKVRDLIADPQLHSLGSIITPFTAVGPIPNNNYTRHQLILARYGPNQRGSGLDCTGNLVHVASAHQLQYQHTPKCYPFFKLASFNG